MNEEKLVKCLAQLGNITRLRIFRLLVKAGKEGLSVGKIQEKLVIPASTLSHHISKLLNLDLIKQERKGTVLNCFANYTLLDDVISELQDQCCLDDKSFIKEDCSNV
ncbi:MAG: transcriptional regulator [Arcobacter sp.]|nr:MAG: transcriptional regulator [Arcobacter sp.]